MIMQAANDCLIFDSYGTEEECFDSFAPTLTRLGTKVAGFTGSVFD
jgi:hypothetical protein